MLLPFFSLVGLPNPDRRLHFTFDLLADSCRHRYGLLPLCYAVLGSEVQIQLFHTGRSASGDCVDAQSHAQARWRVKGECFKHQDEQ